MAMGVTWVQGTGNICWITGLNREQERKEHQQEEPRNLDALPELQQD